MFQLFLCLTTCNLVPQLIRRASTYAFVLIGFPDFFSGRGWFAFALERPLLPERIARFSPNICPARDMDSSQTPGVQPLDHPGSYDGVLSWSFLSIFHDGNTAVKTILTFTLSNINGLYCLYLVEHNYANEVSFWFLKKSKTKLALKPSEARLRSQEWVGKLLLFHWGSSFLSLELTYWPPQLEYIIECLVFLKKLDIDWLYSKWTVSADNKSRGKQTNLFVRILQAHR